MPTTPHKRTIDESVATDHLVSPATKPSDNSNDGNQHHHHHHHEHQQHPRRRHASEGDVSAGQLTAAAAGSILLPPIPTRTQLNPSDDVRIRSIDPLIPPQILMEDIPLTSLALRTVQTARTDCQRVIQHDHDDRLLVIVGPCSIHDASAARVYAQRLKEQIQLHAADLVIVMRVYFEKPRTTVGWKGLINDPYLDGSFTINKGLRIARQLLLDVNELGVPAGVEFLDTITPQFLGDLIAWGAIGARTTESQIHRELASGVSCPVGFKNGTSGSVDIAVDAIRAAKAPHHFLSVTKQGLAAIVTTEGNPGCHLILRGGKAGPNYGAEHLQDATDRLRKAGVNDGIMIDCSHGNSNKDYRNQPKVATAVGKLLAAGATNIVGVMIESNLHEGRQDIPADAGLDSLQYGVSVTDGCIGWPQTVDVLAGLAAAVRVRRQTLLASSS